MKQLFHILSYPLTGLFYLLFGLTLVIFHPIQWVSFNLFGYRVHKKSVDCFNWTILRCLNILGTTFEVETLENIPKNVPIIMVSNHQSMWDISPISWFLREYHPKFISKLELGKGIPSISYNLRHGGSILIDRNNPRQALSEMMKFARYLVRYNRLGVIFPEGTRSRNGDLKPFYSRGLSTLFKYAPTALIVPITINNSWKLQRFGFFPMPLGVRLKLTVHPAMNISRSNSEERITLIEETIKSKLNAV